MIGVVGGGQLARMLVQAASARSIPIAVQTSSASDPAADAAARIVEADPRDVAGTRELVEGCEGITFENEWVNIDALIPLEQQGVRFPSYPPRAAFAITGKFQPGGRDGCAGEIRLRGHQGGLGMANSSNNVR